MPSDPLDPAQLLSHDAPTFKSRAELVQTRVNDAARALQERGLRPTVARIRAALGGGSPNDLTPALKHWRDAVLPSLPAGVRNAVTSGASTTVPPPIADLAHELWQRATAAAVVELKGGPTARQVAERTEEAHALRDQVGALRNQLQRESLAYGELRAQAARHEAIAREALARAHSAEERERDLLRNLGATRQRVAELEATLVQQTAHRTRPTRRRRQPSVRKKGPATKQSNRRPAKAPRKRDTRTLPKPAKARPSAASTRRGRRR